MQKKKKKDRYPPFKLHDIKKTRDSFNIDQARARPSPFPSKGTQQMIEFSVFIDSSTGLRLSQCGVGLLVCLGKIIIFVSTSHTHKKGGGGERDSGVVSQTPTLVAWLPCSSAPTSTPASTEVALETKASLPPPPSPASRCSLFPRPKKTRPVGSSAFSGESVVLLPRQN